MVQQEGIILNRVLQQTFGRAPFSEPHQVSESTWRTVDYQSLYQYGFRLQSPQPWLSRPVNQHQGHPLSASHSVQTIYQVQDRLDDRGMLDPGDVQREGQQFSTAWTSPSLGNVGKASIDPLLGYKPTANATWLLAHSGHSDLNSELLAGSYPYPPDEDMVQSKTEMEMVVEKGSGVVSGVVPASQIMFSPGVDLTSAGGVALDLLSSQQDANAVCNQLQAMQANNEQFREENSLLSEEPKTQMKKQKQEYQPAKCAACSKTTSTEWRRGPSGKRECCNACGL
ncbi:hypothetical protein AJ80_09855 [Polytolypa hystricis UAMH7299]|uniref:GATA-type domain-containing protein n=1 Tax=Polytolypa hystricis (strain UAMH7299) TaxID=1447883 RepID=A0A2B7WI97_POLH7|nr:hypothetical protein AJ80_09855 [Polytolypa hystricis UAMH7299]